MIADITSHSDCNHVTCHERKPDLRGWRSGGRWVFHSACYGTSGHGTFDPVGQLQQKIAQNDRQRIEMEGMTKVLGHSMHWGSERSESGRRVRVRMAGYSDGDIELHNHFRFCRISFK